MRLISVLASIALVAPLAACGGDDDGPNFSDAGTYLETLVNNLCGKAFECQSTYPGGAAAFPQAWGASEAACKMMFITKAQVNASVSAGKVNYSRANAEACHTKSMWDTMTCDQFWNGTEPTECGGVFMGTVANGAACTISLECVAGSGCNQQMVCQTIPQ